jgi:hypothetical protein
MDQKETNNDTEFKQHQFGEDRCHVCVHRQNLKKNEVYSEEKYKEILRKNKAIYSRKVIALEKDIKRYKFLYEEERIKSDNLELLLEDKRNIIEELKTENSYYKGEIAGHANAISIFTSDLYSKLIDNNNVSKSTQKSVPSKLSQNSAYSKLPQPSSTKLSSENSTFSKLFRENGTSSSGEKSVLNSMKSIQNFEEISEEEKNNNEDFQPNKNVEIKETEEESLEKLPEIQHIEEKNKFVVAETENERSPPSEEKLLRESLSKAEISQESSTKGKSSKGDTMNAAELNYFFNGGKSGAEIEKKTRKKKHLK